MIEITAKFTRGPVYFAGETIKCFVSFKNESDRDEILAWSGVQIHCHCIADDHRVQFDDDTHPNLIKEQFAVGSSDTSFNPSSGEKGTLILSTRPTILFCNLQLKPNQSQTFAYQQAIPRNAPPSHTGSIVKYVYKLTIGTQRVTSPIQLLKIPFKVLTILSNGEALNELHKLHQGDQIIESKLRRCTIDSQMPSLTHSLGSLSSIASNSTHSSLTTRGPSSSTLPQHTSTNVPHSGPSNSIPNGTSPRADGQLDSNSNPFPVPFPLMDDDEKESILDISLHQLDCLTARKTMSTYMITNPHGKVAKFCLLKSRYKLGEDIIGMFNFDEATVPCVQFSVSLQCEEIVSERCRKESNRSKPVSFFTNIVNHARFHQFCIHTSHTQMVLPVPLTVTPAFKTELVSLNWKLHFEFVTTSMDDYQHCSVIRDSQGICEQSPALLNVQTMVWDLPILIYPTHPIQVARGLQIPATSSLIV